MKNVLIVSPHFPPVNSPDLHRVRMSLPFFEELGWTATVLAVKPEFVEGFKDPILEKSVPSNIEVVKVGAYSTKYTRKIGLGALSLRSLNQMRKAGNKLLKNAKFDLIYFSTTAFHVCWLGQYWKKKFKVPFVVDLQDPWRNDFYLDKPKHLRPPKHGFAYTIHKKMEKETMPHVSGVVSVSEGYLQMMEDRYQLRSKKVPMKVIPFGASKRDFLIADQNNISSFPFNSEKGTINVAYVGAVTPFFIPLIEAFFTVFVSKMPTSIKYHFYFLGTSYVAGAEKKVAALAERMGIGHMITEVTDRIPYFQALRTLQAADLLFIPGSQDKDYNASKVYNCILSGTPIFSIFNEASLVKSVIEKTGAGIAVGVSKEDGLPDLIQKIEDKIQSIFDLHNRKMQYNEAELFAFSDQRFAEEQATLFESAVDFYKNNSAL